MFSPGIPRSFSSISALFLIQSLLFSAQSVISEKVENRDGIILKGRRQVSSCNLFQGTWVSDSSYPFYTSSNCPFIDPEFDCIKYGRPDTDFLKYVWKPAACNLPRFDGRLFVKRWYGKKIMFVGDSLGLNMWESLLCMIHASVPSLKYSVSRKEPISYVRFEGGPIIFFHRTTYLVDIVRDKKLGRVLKLDSIQGGKIWKGMNMLVFDTIHWYLHKQQTGYDYIQYRNKTSKSMNSLDAFYFGLSTWANWVDTNVNINTTKIFFQGVSPTHYMGYEWNAAKRTCKDETQPLQASSYPGGSPPAVDVLNKVLSSMKKNVYLLDITFLSQLRKDAHPSTHNGNNHDNDCSHWCLPGLPDTWNQLLYVALTTL